MKKFNPTKIVIFLLLIIVIFQWGMITRLLKPRIAKKQPMELKGKIAIVIDDWGYNQNNLASLKKIPYPLTIAVLPNLSYSYQVSEALHNLGKEIILHLPLEPREKYRLEQNTVLAGMSESQIRKIVSEDLSSLPFVKGVSNHMGSKATEDARTMRIVFDELKKKNLYFLDSFVSTKSICANIAGEKKLLFAKRDIFLDNKEESSYIKSQLNKLKKKATKYGQAIGIGHDKKITLQVLNEMMPELEKEGFSFIFVSDLAG
jgi:polysaccharide deacetylase 2 family uncharacterized protein YibQ